MRLILTVLLVGALLAGYGGAAGANTYNFPNNTYVYGYYKGNPYQSSLGSNGTPNPPLSDTTKGYWYDRIGATVYEIYGVNLVGSTFSIFTNMPADGDTSYGIPVADFFIDAGKDGTWDYAVMMSGSSHDIYGLNGSYQTSDDIFKNPYNGTFYIYGGRYDADGTPGSPYDPRPIPVRIGPGASDIGDAGVVWTSLGGSGGPNSPIYRIDITFPESFWAQITGINAFIWGSGICANDTAQGVFTVEPPSGGVVPIPGSVLLLGSGLAGLGLIYRRMKRRV